MSETIKDGIGRGYLAEVNPRNKIMGDSVMQTEEADIASLGYSFVVSTKVLTLNSTNPHLFLYFKNICNASINFSILFFIYYINFIISIFFIEVI